MKSNLITSLLQYKGDQLTIKSIFAMSTKIITQLELYNEQQLLMIPNKTQPKPQVLLLPIIPMLLKILNHPLIKQISPYLSTLLSYLLSILTWVLRCLGQVICKPARMFYLICYLAVVGYIRHVDQGFWRRVEDLRGIVDREERFYVGLIADQLFGDFDTDKVRSLETKLKLYEQVQAEVSGQAYTPPRNFQPLRQQLETQRKAYWRISDYLFSLQLIKNMAEQTETLTEPTHKPIPTYTPPNDYLTPSKQIDIIEYIRYNLTENFDNFVEERRICVVGVFRDVFGGGAEDGVGDGKGKGNGKGNDGKLGEGREKYVDYFLNSVNLQNYSNYHVYLVDDASSDNSYQYIYNKITQNTASNPHPHSPQKHDDHKLYRYLSNRITLLKNKKPIGKLGSIDQTIRKYCLRGDIVIDVNIETMLIGKQVFNLINRKYVGKGKDGKDGKEGKEDLWFLYSNFVERVDGIGERGKVGDGKMLGGFRDGIFGMVRSGQNSVLQYNNYTITNYRTQMGKWVTGPLRTYLYDLYAKIPVDYFLDKSTNAYYTHAHDRFITFPLLQLSSPSHTKFLDLRLSFQTSPQPNQIPCLQNFFQYYNAQSRILTPFKPLTSLKDETKFVSNYKISKKLLSHYFKMEMELFQCRKKHDNGF